MMTEEGLNSLSILNHWIQTHQFDPCIRCSKLPMRFDTFSVAACLPGPDFSPQGFGIWDAPFQVRSVGSPEPTVFLV